MNYSIRAIRENPTLLSMRNRHLEGQVVLLGVTMLGVWIFMFFSVAEALWQTLILFSFVAVVGLVMITRLSQMLEDPRLQKLGYVFLFKLCALLFVLYAGWIPMLNPDLPLFGYDPQRYYFDAQTLNQAGFDLGVVRDINVNYTGIVYFYGMLFALLGSNPVIPALVNTFITLLASLLVVRVGYQIKREREPRDWRLGLCMIIPEVIWFDGLTSRETLVMSLYVIVTLSMAGYFIRKSADRFTLWHVVFAVPAMLLLGLIRTPILIPTVGSVILLFLAFRMPVQRRLLGFVIIGAAMFVFILVPVLSMRFGSYQFDYFRILDWISRRDETFLARMTWSGRSLGQLLIPDNRVEAVAFVFPRLLIYIVAPWPNIGFSLSGLVNGSWSDWQSLMQSASSLLYIAYFPLAIAALVQAVRRREWKSAFAFNIPCWLMLLTIAGGNQIVHVRYRVMVAILLWGCIWLGRKCNKVLVNRISFCWWIFLALCGIFFVLYKFS